MLRAELTALQELEKLSGLFLWVEFSLLLRDTEVSQLPQTHSQRVVGWGLHNSRVALISYSLILSPSPFHRQGH